MIYYAISALLTVASLSVEEKVGQVLMVHFPGEVANEEARRLIQDIHVGGIIYYTWANGLHSPEQVKTLSEGLQAFAEIPLLIAVDQEGGRVARLKQGFTQSPGNQAIALTGDPQIAEDYAYLMGSEMHAVGINLNLAPVVDVNSNPRNPVIGNRSFGETSDIVIPFAHKALIGYHRAGIFTTLKHFPGHGDVEVDSHLNLPKANHVELRPFAELAPFTDAIMTAHILAPTLDPDQPVTLSKPAIDYLRHQIGFNGLIITDSLVMEGLLKHCPSLTEAAITAFNAGHDILLLGGKQLTGHSLELYVDDIAQIHDSLVQAVKRGKISESRLNEAVERILTLKSKI